MIVETKLRESALFHVHTEVRRQTRFKDAVQAGLLSSPSPLQALATDAAFLDMLDRFHDQEERVLRQGDAALIHVHAFPDLLWHGHVRQIANVPLMIDWRLTDTKVYQTVVTIDELPRDLKPGMTADVTIFPERTLDHVLTVPVEALVQRVKHGEANKCYVLTDEGPEPREVMLGANNDAVVEVKDGIHEGDEVVLNPEAVTDKSRAISGP